jgi:putative alpha-1,2-mannosidase
VHGATLQVGEGKTFVITVKNQSDKNVYVQSARLNGKLLARPFLPVQEVRQGGTLEFVMGSRPNTKGFSPIAAQHGNK